MARYQDETALAKKRASPAAVAVRAAWLLVDMVCSGR